MAQNEETRQNWTSGQAYILASVCLLVGIAMGYLFRGTESKAVASTSVSAPQAAPANGVQAQVTPEQLRQMADKQAAPLLQQLKTSPTDASLLAEVGNIYYDTRNYEEAIKYYDQSLKGDPKNADVRTDFGTAYYYLGDSDRALREFKTVLQNDPKHAQTMFNMGMVQWQGKGDAAAAVASWQQLLKAVPDYPDRAKVEELVARARAHSTMPPGTKTDKPATM
jgi:cytochrome c-type biogenesis protein CcmH/NrfG